jgi:hypothetical protein
VSYRALADDLQRVAAAIRGHEGALQGTQLASAAERLHTALRKFDALLKADLRGVDPAAGVLRDLLETPAARDALDGKLLRLLGKKHTGRTLSLKKDDTPGDRRQRFYDTMVKAGRAAEAAVAIRAYLERATLPAPPPGDRERVLEELWRLANLDEFALAVAQQRLLEDEKLLRAMAGYAFIKISPRSRPKSIFAALLKFSRRVKENTA